MKKKGVLGLDALISILIAVFVLVSILYAESKFMSVQNMEFKKEAKRLSLMSEAMQIMPDGFSMEYKKLNYSLLVSDGKVVITPSDSGWKSENTFPQYSDQKISCSLSVIREKTGEKISDKLPFAVFEKSGNDVICSDKNLISSGGDS
jgi:predicted transcriptional regulator